MRHRPNFRYTALGLPQRLQRVYFRTLNFGSREALMSRHFFGIWYPNS